MSVTESPVFSSMRLIIIITIFPDRDYMQGLYNRLMFIKAMCAV